MANLRRSLVINFFSSSSAALVQFLVSVLLARMLSPSEIGVFSMTVVFVTIAHMFRDFGVATYIQREPELTPEKIRSALGILYATSWSLAVGLFALSAPLGDFFNEPGIVPVMRVLALGFIVIPFGSLTHSMLLRELAADKQAVVTAAGTIAYCASCLILAALDFGTMSLAWANLINICTCALAYIPFRPKGMPWIPSRRGWGRVINFGVGQLLTNCIDAANGSIAELVLGKLGSARHVGLFSRANSTVSIFSYLAGTTVTYGALTYLSQAHHRGESLVPTLRRAVTLLTGIGWPALALTAVFGRDLVLALYGPTWLDSVPAILPLCIAACFYLLFQYTPSALASIGRPYLGAIPQSATLVMRITLGVLLFDGTLVSFGWAVCLATMCVVPVMLYLQYHYLQFKPSTLFASVMPSLAVAVCCTVIGEALHLVLPESLPAMARLLLAFPFVLGTWYGALRLISHPLVNELHLLAGSARLRLSRFGRAS
ncbi:oligosaccharide flippase family protein [Massilia sp. IC2-477]|uniref:oligosaccharide flippase family protein n=1 Tax=Massilia sp. IC2-477 TaxID=2887198 RepID=UPI001D121491|nr:oligosaccharide flippase family protein [Massilia sp. IC2-477]MCC2955050.1 oligosaccharide flippase family protein [Massilia sp. IC2-477]